LPKKPAEQTSNQPGGAGDEVDLGADLDGTNDGDQGGDADDDGGDDDGDQDGSQQTIEQQIQAGIRAALPTITSTFQSEMDRRINSAINKVTRKNGPKPAQKKDADDGEQDENQQQQVQPADVRGARIAFREYLPMEIKTFSTEEQALATEFGQSRIRALALEGFEDEDEAGKQAAQETAEFIKKARALYSKRTKAVLKRQGALVEVPGSTGGQTPGQTPPPADLASAIEAARKKDMELFPHRYQNAQQ
jgi:hypothetical protein